MRRDYFTLQVHDVDWVDEGTEPTLPRLTIRYEGPTEPFREGFVRDDALIPKDEVDVAFRLQAPIEDPDATGVLSLTDRLTGDFLLELDATVDSIVRFIRGARRYGESVGNADDRYQIDVRIDEITQLTFEKRTLLVYHEDGTLLREHSLIPSGVEL